MDRRYGIRHHSLDSQHLLFDRLSQFRRPQHHVNGGHHQASCGGCQVVYQPEIHRQTVASVAANTAVVAASTGVVGCCLAVGPAETFGVVKKAVAKVGVVATASRGVAAHIGDVVHVAAIGHGRQQTEAFHQIRGRSRRQRQGHRGHRITCPVDGHRVDGGTGIEGATRHSATRQQGLNLRIRLACGVERNGNRTAVHRCRSRFKRHAQAGIVKRGQVLRRIGRGHRHHIVRNTGHRSCERRTIRARYVDQLTHRELASRIWHANGVGTHQRVFDDFEVGHTSTYTHVQGRGATVDRLDNRGFGNVVFCPGHGRTSQQSVRTGNGDGVRAATVSRCEGNGLESRRFDDVHIHRVARNSLVQRERLYFARQCAVSTHRGIFCGGIQHHIGNRCNLADCGAIGTHDQLVAHRNAAQHGPAVAIQDFYDFFA